MARVLFISENNIRDAWLSAVIQVLNSGDDIKTEYDKSEDPPSKDATVLIEVVEPFSAPIMRKDKVMKFRSNQGNSYEIYGCMADTYLIGSIQSGYLEEIMEGINDHFIWDSATSFPYSYHDRIFKYTPYSLEDTIHVNYNLETINPDYVKRNKKLLKAEKIKHTPESTIWRINDDFEIDLGTDISKQVGIETLPIGLFKFPQVNQIEYIVETLKEKPYSRRAQAITWRPLVDPFHIDPPCLQRIFMRIKDDKLVMHTTWRSRDLFRAWEANVNGMIRIQKMVADQLEVGMGHYVDFSNSLHIYGSTISEVKDMLIRMKLKGETFPKETQDFVDSLG